MIESLTTEQTAKMSEYVTKYVGIGFSTDNSIKEEDVKSNINSIYTTLLNRKEPEQIVIKSSPRSAWEYICEQNPNITMKDFVWPFFSGSFDSNIFAFYDFFIDEVGITFKDGILEKYNTWKKTLDMGLIFPFDDICIVTKKPTKVSYNSKNQLHCEDGPAIVYEDGFAVYILNGVRMTKEYVETPWNKLDPTIILKETNAEVRRELIRKIGIERFIECSGAKVVDEDGEYQLLMVDIGLGKDNLKPYLKMKNPSIGVYHVEGVGPDCKTVKDALFFRNKTHETHSKLS